MELFEQIRREYEFGEGSIAGVARRLGVHRRMVRQALTDAVPPERKRVQRVCPQLEPVRAFIDEILEEDGQAPRKQRHTAHRIYTRIRKERASSTISERRVRQYVRERKAELGLLAQEVSVPQSYAPGSEGQVDWYEATVRLGGEREVVHILSIRSMASGASFHRAYPRATQQAFLDSHQRAFHYFGGVFYRLRYDNLRSAVWRILKGHRRQETQRFIGFRSHWQFESSFCTPGRGQEKGGVEGEVGYFRRNHLVPLPAFADFEELNTYLLHCCREDLRRIIDGQERSCGERLNEERAHLLALQADDFDLVEEHYCRVDGKGRVQAGTNWYSTPLAAGTQARVQLAPLDVAISHGGREVARHARCYGRRQQRLELEHYLEVLERKPGALAGSTPLAQWRAAGRWSAEHDRFWSVLMERHGRQEGTRLMIELIKLGREHGYERLKAAMTQALDCGAQDAAAVCYLLTAPSLEQPVREPLCAVGLGACGSRPLPTVANYDRLLAPEGCP